nr:V protein [Bat mastadenovirus BtSY2]
MMVLYSFLRVGAKMSSSRAIKQELLEAAIPEVYVEPQRKRKTASRVKSEFEVDVKSLVKSRTKKRRSTKGKKTEADDDLIVGEERRFAPRRPYQWKGRKVRAVVRPGVPVVFTPGQRSGTRAKRDFDNVYGDDDIMDQYDRRENEFAYGKRARLLDVSNPTPELVPVTGQQPIPSGDYAAPGTARLLPTVQVLVPQNPVDLTGPESKKPLTSIKSEAKDVKVEVKDVKPISRDVVMHTVDVKVPLKRKREEDAVYEAAKKIKDEVEKMDTTLVTRHSEAPEAMTFDTGVEPAALFEAQPSTSSGRKIARARYKRPATSAAAQAAGEAIAQAAVQAAVATAAAPSAPVPMEISQPVARVAAAVTGRKRLPQVRYHPSIAAARRGKLPEVRYHPSIVAAAARAGASASTRRRRAATTRRRRRTTTRNSAAGRQRAFFSLPQRNSKGQFLPSARYHPSISMITRRA